ncbi:TPA: hypothetical protein DD394_09335 [bacterium UBP9_UBA11836]|nr:hypothetical protein [bacterium UBP9_UBA11836]
MRRVSLSVLISLSFVTILSLAIFCSGLFICFAIDSVVWNEGARSLYTILYYFAEDDKEDVKVIMDAERERFRHSRPEPSFLQKLVGSCTGRDNGERRLPRCKPKPRTLRLAQFQGNYQKMAEAIGRNCSYVRIYDLQGRKIASSESPFVHFEGKDQLPQVPSRAMFSFLSENWRRLQNSDKDGFRGGDNASEMMAYSQSIIKEAGFTYYGPSKLPRRNGLFHHFLLWLSSDKRGINEGMPPPPHFGPFTLVYVEAPNFQIMLCPITEGDKLTGYIEAAVPWNFADRAIKMAHRLFAIGSIILALLVSVAGICTARVLTTPLQKVVGVAKKLEAGDLSARVHLGEGRNEIFVMANTFDHMLDALQESFLEQQRFIGDASHELKTPLTSLMGAVHVLKLKLEDAKVLDKVQSTVSTIDKELSRMEHLVLDLLTLSRNQELSHRKVADPVSVNEVVKNAVEASLSEAMEHPVETETGCDVWILGDASALARAVRNIIDNALRHTPKEKQVKVSVQVSDKDVKIIVADEGCGISPEHLANLGKRFYRVDTGRDRISGGTGLGIPITEAIVKRHGGSVKFDSKLGEGTQVTITLPLMSAKDLDV